MSMVCNAPLSVRVNHPTLVVSVLRRITGTNRRRRSSTLRTTCAYHCCAMRLYYMLAGVHVSVCPTYRYFKFMRIIMVCARYHFVAVIIVLR